jgi:hypothetical protein
MSNSEHRHSIARPLAAGSEDLGRRHSVAYAASIRDSWPKYWVPDRALKLNFKVAETYGVHNKPFDQWTPAELLVVALHSLPFQRSPTALQAPQSGEAEVNHDQTDADGERGRPDAAPGTEGDAPG